MNYTTKILSLVMLLGTTHTFAMYDQSNNNAIRTIHAIPGYYSDLATKLSQQLPFTGTGSPYSESKILPLQDWDDCKISEILNKNALILSCEVEQIRAFGQNNNQRYAKNRLYHAMPHACLGTGIESYIHPVYITCRPNIRQEIYKKIIETLKKDWHCPVTQDYPTMVHTQSPNRWLLFMKKQSLTHEPELINHLISKFKVDEIMSCNTSWFNTDNNYKITNNGDMYIWVRKDAIDAFDTIFNFEIQEQEPCDTQGAEENPCTCIKRLREQADQSFSSTHLTCTMFATLVCLTLYQCYISI